MPERNDWENKGYALKWNDGEPMPDPIGPSVKKRPFTGKSFSGRLEGFRESENIEDKSKEPPFRQTTDEWLDDVVTRRFRPPRAVEIPEGSKVRVPEDEELHSLPPMYDPSLAPKLKKRR